MRALSHAQVSRGDQRYVASCSEIAVVTQGTTLDETIANLREAVTLHLSGGDHKMLGVVAEPTIIPTMEVQVPA